MKTHKSLSWAWQYTTSTRSKSNIDILHRFGYSVDYNRIMRVETQLTNAVSRQMNESNGVYIPPNYNGTDLYFLQLTA